MVGGHCGDARNLCPVGKNAQPMRRLRGLGILVIVLTVLGVVLLALAADTAYGTFRVRAPNFRQPRTVARRYECGSVLSPKDVRNLVPKTAALPGPLAVGYRRCESKRTQKSDRAMRYLVAGAVILIIAFSVPAIVRGRRRRKHRPRRAYTV